MVDGVSLVYQDKNGTGQRVAALDRVDFSIERGEIVSVLGPNGCGKSTLLLVAAGLLAPTTGAVTYPVYNSGDSRPRMGVVFQDHGLFHWMTIKQNIEFVLKPISYTPSERQAAVEKFIGLVGLQGFEDVYPRQLSGGMQQRAAIARALAISPEFLFLDEPFASLDLQTRDILQEEFLRIWQIDRVTTLFVTHSIEEAIYLSHKVIVLTRRPGSVKQIFPVPFVYPRSPELRLRTDFLDLKASIWGSLREEIEIDKEKT